MNPYRGWEIMKKGIYDILINLWITMACRALSPKMAWG